MKHLCHARNCDKECKPEFLMCPKHWKMVPPNLQQDVYKHYRKGQCDDKKPSEEWLAAADAAIKSVSATENRADPRQLDMFGSVSEPKKGGMHGG